MRLMKLVLSFVLVSGITACGGGGGGSPSPSSPTSQAPNSAPAATVLASGVQAPTGNTPDLNAAVGSDISLSGASSTDPDGDILTFSWALATKPIASQLSVASSAALVNFRLDVLGTYTFVLRVTDSKGAFSEKTISIVANNMAPTSGVLITATYSAVPTTMPTRAINIGDSVLLDASSSTDPDGDPVTTTWSLSSRPTTSSAALTLNGQTARFTADRQGVYRVTAHGQDSRGAYSETTYVVDAQNSAPNAILVASVIPVVRDSGQNTIQASTGYNIVLDASTSSDVDGGALTRSWQLISRPTTSTAQLSAASGAVTQIVPDLLGSYVVRVSVTDSAGASATYTTTINVNNNRPVAGITTNASPVSLPSAPSLRVPINTQLTLRGGSSYDADGGTISYLWSVVSAPSGSTAGLATPTTVNTQFVPDLGGSYTIRLRVTDPVGAFSDRLLIVDIGNYPPVAMVDRSRVSVIQGAAITASAALSYDEDGDSLTYTWALDARPNTSTANIAATHSSTLNFTPDVPGTYVASVTVNDGTMSSVAYVTVRALSTVSGSVALSFAPLDAKYSIGLDKLIVVSTNPDAMKIVDPFTGSINTVVLPFAVKSFGLSPDGKLAAILHEGRVSLINLETASLVQTSFTGGSQTDVFLQNDAVAYLIGQTGGQWVTPPVTIMNVRTGATLPVPSFFGGGAFFYGTQKGVFADKKNRVLFMAYGLSPSDISYFTVDQAQHTVLSSGDSPYHGDYPLGAEFYLSENQSLLFTSYGNFFNADTLSYAGSLGLNGGVLSMSQSTSADELLVLQMASSYPDIYNSSYKRYFGALFQSDPDIPLPLIGGQQSYGIKIFHSANARHVILVQTGSAQALASGIHYHVIYR